MLLRSSRGWERVISELAMLEMCLLLSVELCSCICQLLCQWECSATMQVVLFHNLTCGRVKNFSGDLSLWNVVPFVPQWLNVCSSTEDSPAHACWIWCCNWSKQLHCSCSIYPIIFSGPWVHLWTPFYLWLHWRLLHSLSQGCLLILVLQLRFQFKL